MTTFKRGIAAKRRWPYTTGFRRTAQTFETRKRRAVKAAGR